MIKTIISYLKKAIKLIVFFLFAVFTFNSCDLDELLEDDEKNEFLVTEAEARISAGNLLFPPREPQGNMAITLRAGDYTDSKDIATTHTIRGNQSDALFYIINYVDGGFVILSADKRVEPVLAYSSLNEFSMREESYPPGLVDWLEEYASLIIDIRRENLQPSEEVSLMWRLIINDVINVDFLDIISCPIGEEQYIEKKILLKSKWGQGCGYNAALTDSCTVRCDRPPVGCVATAVAQILKYHADNGWNGSYTLASGFNAPQLNWAGMPLTGVDENNHGHIHLLMSHLGPMLDMSYSCSGSGAGITKALDAFKNNFSFSTAKIRDINSITDYNYVISDLKNNRPVYMRGRETKTTETLEGEIKKTYSGHAWVADGYSQLFRCGDGFIANNYMIHMNWGWGGSSSDGFYLKKEGRFEEDRKIIWDIK
jgi:hypothetical protein